MQNSKLASILGERILVALVTLVVLLGVASTAYSFEIRLSNDQLSAIAATQDGWIEIAGENYHVSRPGVVCRANGDIEVLFDIATRSARLGRFRVLTQASLSKASQTVLASHMRLSLIRAEPYFQHSARQHLERWRTFLSTQNNTQSLTLGVLPGLSFLKFDRLQVIEEMLVLSTDL